MKIIKVGAGTVLPMILAVIGLGTAISVYADQPTGVSSLIKCHEGKFDAMNAVSELNQEVSGEAGDVFGWSGIGGYPDGHMDGHLIVVRAPFIVSAPTFVTTPDGTPWACVTVRRK